MNINEIMTRRKQLEHDLYIALSTMERKDTIRKIKEQIIDNQSVCPHFSVEFNLPLEGGDHCPYCGKRLILKEDE